MPADQTDYEARAADRLTLFSDAVVAIAITLLAIDLPLPEGDTVSGFWLSARHDSGHYAAFLISFFAIAAAWRDHHDIFRYVRRVDSRLRTIVVPLVVSRWRHQVRRRSRRDGPGQPPS